MLEINRLDKIARRSKRVGGAIADLWGGQYLCFGRELYGEKLSLTEKSISRVPYLAWTLLGIILFLRSLLYYEGEGIGFRHIQSSVQENN